MSLCELFGIEFCALIGITGPTSAGVCPWSTIVHGLPRGANNRCWSLLHPIFGPRVFDRLRRLFGRPDTGGDGQSLIVKDATRLAPKKLIHREANPARMIHLQSKSFVEGILDRLSGPKLRIR